MTAKMFSTANVNEKVCEYVRKGVGSSNEKHICRTCVTYLKKGKIPPCAEYIKMTLPGQGP